MYGLRRLTSTLVMPFISTVTPEWLGIRRVRLLTGRGLVGGRQFDVGAGPEPAEDVQWLQILPRLAALEVAQPTRGPDVHRLSCSGGRRLVRQTGQTDQTGQRSAEESRGEHVVSLSAVR